jgi:hypothetical protein
MSTAVNTGSKKGKPMLGMILSDDSYDRVVTADEDFYDGDELVFKFRKKVIPGSICMDGYANLRAAAVKSANRGTATQKGAMEQPIRKNGKRSNTSEVPADQQINSGIVGYYDRYPRTPFCRQTSYTANNMEKFKRAYPIIKFVDRKFAELVPEQYALQREIADRTSKDFVIPDTAFTTVTVNKNWQTAVHTDSGDFEKGFGNLVVFKRGYKGGYFVLPAYRVAIDIDTQDLLLVNVHEPHGNSPIHALAKSWERISLVMYYRQNMIHCGTAAEELERAKSRRPGDHLF